MLRIIELNSWADFQKNIERQLHEETQELMAGPFFYRGHSDSDWPLETTLERSIGPNQDVTSYYRIIERLQAEIETFTDRDWNLPSYQSYVDTIVDDAWNLIDLSRDYMKYLRHFGFPSPLLDWTFSPFIAAYFAFSDITNKAKSIAIY